LNLRNSSVPYRYYKQSYHFWGLCTLIRSNYSKLHQLLSVHFFKIENRKIIPILSFFTMRRTHKNKMQQALKSKIDQIDSGILLSHTLTNTEKLTKCRSRFLIYKLYFFFQNCIEKRIKFPRCKIPRIQHLLNLHFMGSLHSKKA